METNKPFLSAVADWYLAAGAKRCIGTMLIFPNKRARIFFLRYFKQQAKGASAVPRLNSVGAFYAAVCPDLELVDGIEGLFILYKAYCEVLEAHPQHAPMEFDRFAYWGRMILQDFDDIDASLAEGADVYTNLKRLKEIGSYYLNDEQLEVIRSIWGQEVADSMRPDDPDRFWRHLGNPDGEEADETKQKFMHLWEIMADLYAKFHEQLKAAGKTTPGLIARQALEVVKDHPEQLGFSRLGFVGFNRPNNALARIMQIMQTRGRAEFFWDTLPDSARAYAPDAYNTMLKLAAHFKMPDGFEVPRADHIAEIKIYASPSNHYQTKQAGKIIDDWMEQRRVQYSRPDSTAVILPDGRLLPAMLHALPDDVHTVNISMGLPFRETPFATLIDAIVSMRMRSRVDKTGRRLYFHDDVKSIVTHPQLRAIAIDDCLAVQKWIDDKHQFNIAVDDLRGLSNCAAMNAMFSDIADDTDPKQVAEYLRGVIDGLRKAIADSVSAVNASAHEVKVLNAYAQAVTQVMRCVDKYGVSVMGEAPLLRLVRSILRQYALNHTGTPLKGLQILGPLETRAIDFDNVVMLSMNERTMPPRGRMTTLIPLQLRSAYGLPTREQTDTEYSYYIARLVSRAQRVVFIYDSRVGGTRSGAMSRYLLQLQQFAPKGAVKSVTLTLPAHLNRPRKITVEKTPEIMAQVDRLRQKGTGFNLSASALKKFRQCPFLFYLNSIVRIRPDEEPVDYMTAIEQGNVVHHVMERLYNEVGTHDITAEVIQSMLDRDLLGIVKEEIDHEYHREAFKGRLDALPYSSVLLAESISEQIRATLKKEKAETPFTFVAAEETLASGVDGIGQWQVTPDLAVNWRMSIDRHDMLSNGQHRFIDYKTGSDKHSVSKNIMRLFDPEPDKANDAILQLLAYCEAYADLKKDFKGDIHPALYRMRYACGQAEGEKDPAFEKDEVKVGSEILNWAKASTIPHWQPIFRMKLEEMIADIFDPEQPFSQTECADNCKYCDFVQICGRTVKDDQY